MIEAVQDQKDNVDELENGWDFEGLERIVLGLKNFQVKISQTFMVLKVLPPPPICLREIISESHVLSAFCQISNPFCRLCVPKRIYERVIIYVPGPVALPKVEAKVTRCDDHDQLGNCQRGKILPTNFPETNCNHQVDGRVGG